MFPEWGEWAFGDVGETSKVALADYVSTTEFVPRRTAPAGRKSPNYDL